MGEGEWPPRGLIAAALLLIALLGGRPSAEAAGADATASRTVTVTMDHFEYQPKTLSIASGTRVVFSNTAPKVKHTATSKGSFTTGKIKPGAAVAVKFSAKGTYPYHCTIHPDMRGKVVVG